MMSENGFESAMSIVEKLLGIVNMIFGALLFRRKRQPVEIVRADSLPVEPCRVACDWLEGFVTGFALIGAIILLAYVVSRPSLPRA